MSNAPTAETIAKGLKAYEQARAYERVRTWRLPLTYALAPLVLAVLAVALWHAGHPAYFAIGAGFSLFVGVRVCIEWQRLRRLYDDNLRLLGRLEATHGDTLPWVQVEKHFAELEKIQREIAETREAD